MIHSVAVPGNLEVVCLALGHVHRGGIRRGLLKTDGAAGGHRWDDGFVIGDREPELKRILVRDLAAVRAVLTIVDEARAVGGAAL